MIINMKSKYYKNINTKREFSINAVRETWKQKGFNRRKYTKTINRTYKSGSFEYFADRFIIEMYPCIYLRIYCDDVSYGYSPIDPTWRSRAIQKDLELKTILNV